MREENARRKKGARVLIQWLRWNERGRSSKKKMASVRVLATVTEIGSAPFFSLRHAARMADKARARTKSPRAGGREGKRVEDGEIRIFQDEEERPGLGRAWITRAGIRERART